MITLEGYALTDDAMGPDDALALFDEGSPLECVNRLGELFDQEVVIENRGDRIDGLGDLRSSYMPVVWEQRLQDLADAMRGWVFIVTIECDGIEGHSRLIFFGGTEHEEFGASITWLSGRVEDSEYIERLRAKG